MTYCVGVVLDAGLVFASDSRTHAGVDNFASFCKMTVFERPGDRVIVLLSSGNLAGTQAVVSVLRQRAERGESPNLWTARSMFDVAMLVSQAVRDVERRDGEHLERSAVRFDASFIIGGQIGHEPMRLFRTFAEGNFIEAQSNTCFFQTGEVKYGKPIIDWVITPSTNLADAAKCVLLSFDSSMRSNLSVGMPIDLLCYEPGTLRVRMRRRFAPGDWYFRSLGKEWGDGVLEVVARLPSPDWAAPGQSDDEARSSE